jgi:RHS repeat-associated protein
MSLVYNINRFQNAVSHSFPFGEVRRGSSFNAYNCMKAYSFNGERYGYYGYDASGERTYKYDIFSAGSWTNQTGGMDVSLQIDKMMLYPNGYLNMNQNGEYTKHYYADALRIASKIGSGFSQNLCYEANQIGDDIDPNYLEDRRDKQYDEMMEELTELINGNQITDINPIPYPEANLCNLSGSGIETALFFYHPDHLGSTGMVTNNSSNITQGFLYAPFGEIITEFNPSWESGRIPKYSFNAKELDEENGMYYYSARYYAPPTFISRDPMFEKYPSISPYTYCSNNPVIFVDPTGKSISEFDEAGNYLRTTKDNWFHNTFFGRTGRIVDGDGNVTQKFKFADPKNDVNDLKSGKINRVQFVQESEIKSMLSKAGAFDKENKVANSDSRYDYINQEGKGGGKFDFAVTGIPNQYSDYNQSLFLVDGVAHNRFNFGNFLFGAAGKALGLTSFELRAGAHYNSVFNSSTNGYKPQLDSRDDQRSIRMGVRHANQHDYKNMHYRVTFGPLQRVY